ncbi:MAG: tetratricopeptide repeat protein [Thermodesulfovibrionales bacterium]|nr:tetratricopeptide repeat protein [Thermodesulfovibrionales bacterium]
MDKAVLKIQVRELFERGKKALRNGDTLHALVCFERAYQMENSPEIASYYAFCLAKERGKIQRAFELCRDALDKDPSNSVHYLNLGRIYLVLNNKPEAIKAFREGLAIARNEEIIEELQKLGIRKPPPVPFLKRSNPINKYLGIILKRLGLR